MVASCKKESKNIFNMFDVSLTLHNDKPNAVSEYVEANPGDSLVVDFTINSQTKDMYMICVLKVGSNTPFIKIPVTDAGKRRSYSGVIDLVADQGVGTTSYRIWALDKEGVYLGDGYKKITIHVLADYRHLPNRSLYFPDSAGRQSNCYLSLSKGTTYSYTTGAEHAADIDLGIYRKPVFNPTTGDLIGYTINLYSLSASPNPFTPYDVSSWTKRATLFSAPVNGSANNFRDMFKTGKAIEAEAKKKTINLTQISGGLLANQFVYFLTPEGKYGVLMVNAYTDDYNGQPFMNVSVKIQN
jgi:hypothetical protein